MKLIYSYKRLIQYISCEFTQFGRFNSKDWQRNNVYKRWLPEGLGLLEIKTLLFLSLIGAVSSTCDLCLEDLLLFLPVTFISEPETHQYT